MYTRKRFLVSDAVEQLLAELRAAQEVARQRRMILTLETEVLRLRWNLHTLRELNTCTSVVPKLDSSVGLYRP